MTDLMILPAKIVQGKVDAEKILEIKDQCFEGEMPGIGDLKSFQREVREIVKILIHLFEYVEEKYKNDQQETGIKIYNDHQIDLPLQCSSRNSEKKMQFKTVSGNDTPNFSDLVNRSIKEEKVSDQKETAQEMIARLEEEDQANLSIESPFKRKKDRVIESPTAKLIKRNQYVTLQPQVEDEEHLEESTEKSIEQSIDISQSIESTPQSKPLSTLNSLADSICQSLGTFRPKKDQHNASFEAMVHEERMKRYQDSTEKFVTKSPIQATREILKTAPILETPSVCNSQTFINPYNTEQPPQIYPNEDTISPINSFRYKSDAEPEPSTTSGLDDLMSTQKTELVFSPASSREEVQSPTSSVVMQTKRELTPVDMSRIEELKQRRMKERQGNNFATLAHKQRILVNMSFEAMNQSMQE